MSPDSSSSNNRAITSRDIAQAAGVSQSTVSRALRDDPQITAALRAKVKEVATKLGYRPNPFVTAFTTQVLHHRRSPQSATIALLDFTPKGKKDYGLLYRKGAQERAHALGFSTELMKITDLDGSIKRLNKILYTRSIRAALVLPVPDGFDMTAFDFGHMAAATVDPSLHKPVLHRAEPYYFQGMELALSVLESRGHRRIAFCTSQEEVEFIGAEWLGAFTAWQYRKPKKDRMEPFILKDWDKTDFIPWLQKHQPDALVSNIEYFCSLAGEWKPMPSEIAFASLGAGPHLSHLAGVNQNSKLVGATAIDNIVAQIHRNEFGLPTQPKTLMVQCTWEEGPTVRPGC